MLEGGRQGRRARYGGYFGAARRKFEVVEAGSEKKRRRKGDRY